MSNEEKKEVICPLIGAACIKENCALWMDGFKYRKFGNHATEQGACALVAQPIMMVTQQAAQAQVVQRLQGGAIPPGLELFKPKL